MTIYMGLLIIQMLSQLVHCKRVTSLAKSQPKRGNATSHCAQKTALTRLAVVPKHFTDLCQALEQCECCSGQLVLQDAMAGSVNWGAWSRKAAEVNLWNSQDLFGPDRSHWHIPQVCAMCHVRCNWQTPVCTVVPGLPSRAIAQRIGHAMAICCCEVLCCVPPWSSLTVQTAQSCCCCCCCCLTVCCSLVGVVVVVAVVVVVVAVGHIFPLSLVISKTISVYSMFSLVVPIIWKRTNTSSIQNDCSTRLKLSVFVWDSQR